VNGRSWVVLMASLPTVIAGSPVVAGSASEADSGRTLYAYHCESCHAPGPNHPGTQALALKYGGKVPAVLLERKNLAPNFIRAAVRRGINAMPPYRLTEISDAELEALVTFITDAGEAPGPGESGRE